MHVRTNKNNKSDYKEYPSRCNRLKCPLVRLSGLQCHNMGHNSHGIYLYGVRMIIMKHLNAGGHSDRGTLSPSTPGLIVNLPVYLLG